MNEVTIFSSREFEQVRTVTIDGEAWFVANDIARALGYVKGRDAVLAHVDVDDAAKYGITDSLGRMQQTTVINESGLYALIFGSKLETAKRFKHWVTSEVLPSIRRNGGYIANQEELTPEQVVANALIVAQNIIAQKDEKIRELSPKAEYFDALVSKTLLTNFRDTAKELGYSQNQFVGWLLENKYVYKDSAGILKPYEQYRKQGLFEMKDFTNPYNGYAGVRTFVTVKGKDVFRLLLQVPDREVV